MIRVAAMLVVGVMALGLAACSDEEGGSSAAASSSAASSSETASEAPSGTPDDGDTISVFDLDVGECYDSDDETTVEEVTQLDCAEPHDYEVIASAEHSAGSDADYPGDDAILAFAEGECRSAFEDFVGISFDDSELLVFLLHPTEETWRIGDREVLCSAYLEGEKLEGSVEGTNR